MAGRAPGSLGLVQDFVNTLEMEPRDDDIEQLGTSAALTAWLTDRGLLAGSSAGDADLALLNRVAEETGLRPRFEAGGGVVLEPAAGGVPGALGRLVAAVSEAMNAGTWRRLKACGDQGCRWAFYDGSKNRSGHWCSMESCGNRAKAQQFR